MSRVNEKWNLLFIFPDQQRYDTFAANGNSKIMPNLNRLAEQSAVFKRTYVTQPVCTASRASLMTGMYPHNHGCVTNNIALSEELPALPKLLGDGYRSAYFGKWHLGNERSAQHGFDEWYSIEDGYREYASDDGKSSYHHFLRSHGFMPDINYEEPYGFTRDYSTRVPEAFSKPAFIANEASRFIRQNKDRPFLACISFLEPHPPYNSAFDDMYDPNEIDLPPLFYDELPDNVPLKYHANRKFNESVGRQMPMKDEQTWRRLIARYWGACTLIDKSLGRILKTLEENGLMEKTVIVYTSDHGDMLGDYRMLQKSVMYESSTRVPMIIKVPGMEPRHIDVPVSHVDLIPTILELLGAPDAPSTVEGTSWGQLMRTGEQEPRDVFVEWNGDSPKKLRKKYKEGQLDLDTERSITSSARGVVTPDLWKLSLSNVGEHELYDLNTDPHERKNLYFDEAYYEQRTKLTKKILEWQAQTGDKLDLPNIDLDSVQTA